MKKKPRIRWSRELTAGSNARAVLPELAADYFALSEKACRPEASERELHEFRLATKRFRYTLEMFVPLYDAGLETRIKRIRRVQQALGEIQDCETVRTLPAVKKNKRVAAWLDERLRARRAAFHKIWRTEFGGPTAARSWISFLSRPEAA